uniref:SAP domain-containing protein n=1 Tax=viral metagenome TaxID=1070528 RepID=A0A6C0H4I4_9ZZZZ
MSKDIFLKYLNEKVDTLESNTKCLISNELLTTNFITLECNHKFNYMELYNEVLEQKTKKLLDNSKLKLNEVKCPYCRAITKNILPYLKYYDTKIIKGVNYPYDLSIKLNECQYIEKNSELCKKSACITKLGIFCNSHVKYNIKEEEILNTISGDVLNAYKKKTIQTIKTELRENNIKLSGKKEELINRLLIYYETIKQ